MTAAAKKERRRQRVHGVSEKRCGYFFFRTPPRRSTQRLALRPQRSNRNDGGGSVDTESGSEEAHAEWMDSLERSSVRVSVKPPKRPSRK
ncbi:hypothetical protein MTO96_018091 [Rhipicephalus appendiculatus]